jgi:ketosteroid isomerase-like protein
MASRNLETIRAYLAASDRGDWETMRRAIGDGYTYIDHTTDVVARAPEELRTVGDEARAWSNQRYEIAQAHEATDGTLILQATFTRTLSGQWRGVEPTGQRVSTPVCLIVRFDDDGRIVFEEQYEDALSVMRQLGTLT